MRWGDVVFLATTCVLVKTIFIRLTFNFVISIHVDQEMASNDFRLSSSSDSEVSSEMEDYELEVEGSPNSSSIASDEEGMQKAYANNPLVDEEWLELYERDRKWEVGLFALTFTVKRYGMKE